MNAPSADTSNKPGWFTVHVSEAPWRESEHFGLICSFEGNKRSWQMGINIRVLQPGQGASLYHRENGEENFLVLSGACILIIDGKEQLLRAGHFVHCPSQTNHAFVGAGDGPCAILMTGARPDDPGPYYPIDDAATKHGVTASAETSSPREAYGKLPLFDKPAQPVWPLW